MIIGIGHRSRHGKDTVANLLVERLLLTHPKLSVQKLSWAWKLKDVAFQLYGHLGLRYPAFYETEEGASLRNVKIPGIDKTPVEIWIDLGTPAIRDNVWHETWVSWVKAQQSTCNVIVCPDTRFLNEVEACAVTIKVWNPCVPPRVGKSVDEILAHYTGWDHVIVNEWDMDHLREDVNALVDRIF